LRGTDVVARYGYSNDDDRALEDHGAHFKVRHGDSFEVRDGIAIFRVGIDRRALVEVASDELMTQFFTDDGDGVINAKDAWLARDGDEKELDRLMQGSARRMLLGDSGEKKTFFHRNHLGSVLATTDGQGNINERLAYHPYGTVRWASAGMDTEAAAFGELERDPTTGLHYGASRDYDPAVGRWTTPDPAFDRVVDDSLTEQRDLQGAYVYVDGRPTRAVDKRGKFLDPVSLGAIIGAVSGGLSTYAIIKAQNKNLPKSKQIRGWKLVGRVLFGAGVGAAKGALSLGISAVGDAIKASSVITAETMIYKGGASMTPEKARRIRRNAAIVSGVASAAVNVTAAVEIAGAAAGEVALKVGSNSASTTFKAWKEHKGYSTKTAILKVLKSPYTLTKKLGKSLVKKVRSKLASRRYNKALKRSIKKHRGPKSGRGARIVNKGGKK
jgi:RHS repeat-associated protein